MKNLKNKIFPLLIALSALSVSASAAFYSVSGLSKLFAGATLEVIIMASSLEIAKLVIASLLYQYWDSINKGLRAYLTIAAGVLILITSMGIYGFLSAAYQETANKAGNIDAQVSLVEVKRDNIKEQLAVYTTEKESINKSVNDLRAGLASNIQTYKDKDGNILSSSSSANRKAFERQLDQAIIRQNEINSKVDQLNTQLFDYETEIVNIKTNSELAGELGPLKYLSGLTGVPMDKIINILLLIIIFVFDPLAIALVIAANFAFTQLRPKKEYPLEEQVDDMRKVVDAYDTLKDEIEDNEGSDIYTKEDFSDWDSTLMDGLKDKEWKEQPKGVPVYFDPETKRPYVIEENEEDEELEDKDLVKPEIEVKMSGEPSLNMLSEEEKQYDLNNDGILDNQEQARLRDDKLLNNPGISSWRKKKLRDYLDGNTKTYF